MSIDIITSAQNVVFKKLKTLLTTKGIRKDNQSLLSGTRAIRDALSANGDLKSHAQWIVTEKMQDHELIALFACERKSIGLSSELFSELDIFGIKEPLLLIDVPAFPSWDFAVQANVGNVADPKVDKSISAPTDAAANGPSLMIATQDPTNLGAILRSAAAFKINNIVLLKECAHPFHPKSLRAASAAFTQLKFYSGPSITGITHPVLSLDLEGESLNDFQWPTYFSLLVGEEGRGVPSTLTGTKIHIPMAPGVESLNAAVATSIALFSYRTQHPL